MHTATSLAACNEATRLHDWPVCMMPGPPDCDVPGRVQKLYLQRNAGSAVTTRRSGFRLVCSVPVTRSPARPARHTAARLQLGLHRKRGRMQDADPDQLGWAGVEAAVHSMLGRKQRCIRLLGCMDGWDGWMDAQTRRERRPRPGCEEAAGGEARSGRPGGHGHGQAGQAKKQKEAKGRSPRPPARPPFGLHPCRLPLSLCGPAGWLAGWPCLTPPLFARSRWLAALAALRGLRWPPSTHS